jgi:tRNA (adenine37-N6)-methyltransferase
MSQKEFNLTPIGQVSAGPDGYMLKIDPKYRPALLGLEGFGHINVLWWSHLLDADEQRKVLEVEQPYKNGPAKMGIFATRSPLRPNPICVSTVSVLSVDVENGLVIIPWIDAENGTPILDIKSYQPSADRVRDFCMPDWCAQLPACLEDSAEFDWDSFFTWET